MLMKKRLHKAGCRVHVAANGLACVDEFARRRRSVTDGAPTRSEYDVVLMDMQMPIMDGGTATQRIRQIERESGIPRIPIFAVSASLREESKEDYVDFGFDGWVMKPVDFGRVDKLFAGIYDANRRREEIYIKGEWERGGWFSANATCGGKRVATTDKTDWYRHHEGTGPDEKGPSRSDQDEFARFAASEGRIEEEPEVSSKPSDNQVGNQPIPTVGVVPPEPTTTSRSQTDLYERDPNATKPSDPHGSSSSTLARPTPPSRAHTAPESRPSYVKGEASSGKDPEATKEHWQDMLRKLKNVARTRYGKLFGS